MATASSLWLTFGKQLKEPRRLDNLEEISAIICKNNETALPEHEDYQPWFDSFTGMNLRWETVGSVFAALTTALLSLPERDAFFCSTYYPVLSPSRLFLCSFPNQCTCRLHQTRLSSPSSRYSIAQKLWTIRTKTIRNQTHIPFAQMI
jgi:hypothetical protein